MIKILINLLVKPKVGANRDARIWIQKILLEEKYRKNNS